MVAVSSVVLGVGPGETEKGKTMASKYGCGQQSDKYHRINVEVAKHDGGWGHSYHSEAVTLREAVAEAVAHGYVRSKGKKEQGRHTEYFYPRDSAPTFLYSTIRLAFRHPVTKDKLWVSGLARFEPGTVAAMVDAR